MYQYIAIVLLAIALGVTINSNIEKNKEIKSLEDSIDAYNKAEKESVKTITKIREVVKNVKEPCDCYISFFHFYLMELFYPLLILLLLF